MSNASSISTNDCGSLGETRVQDVLLQIEQLAIDAQAWFEADGELGEVLFHQGQIVRARFGGARGKTALLRLLAISEGKYGVKVCPVPEEPAIVQSVCSLTELHKAREAKWIELCANAPPLSSVLSLTSKGVDVRDASRGIRRVALVLIDGRRTLMEILHESSFDPVESLTIIIEAVGDGMAKIAPPAPSLFPLAIGSDTSGTLHRIVEPTPALRLDPGQTNPSSVSFLDRKPTLAGLGSKHTLRSQCSGDLVPSRIVGIADDNTPQQQSHSAEDMGSLSGKYTTASAEPKPAAPRRSAEDMGSLSGEYATDGAGPKAAGPRRYIDRYEILLRIGRGTMGTVYLARLSSGHVGFTRLYAVKLLRSHLSVDTQAARDFLEEARIAGRLHHANVVSVHDAGFHGSQPYLVMDYIEGCSLNQLTRDTTNRSPYFILPIIIDALAGLQVAHSLQDEQGLDLKLVHCDVSPENLLVGVDGTCRLSDFGMARKADRLLGATIEGKANYVVAPEQIVGDAFDHRADIFSMGVVLWTALTGQRLFDGQTVEDTLSQVCNKPIVPPSALRAQSSRALDEVVMRALQRNPNDRFESAEDMLAALRRVATHQGGLATPKEIASWVKNAAGAELTQRRLAILDASRNNPTVPPPPVESSPAPHATVDPPANYSRNSSQCEFQSSSPPPHMPRPNVSDAVSVEPTEASAISSTAGPSSTPPRSGVNIGSFFYGKDDYAQQTAQRASVIAVAATAKEPSQSPKRRFQLPTLWALAALLALIVSIVNLVLMRMHK